MTTECRRKKRKGGLENKVGAIKPLQLLNRVKGSERPTGAGGKTGEREGGGDGPEKRSEPKKNEKNRGGVHQKKCSTEGPLGGIIKIGERKEERPRKKIPPTHLRGSREARAKGKGLTPSEYEEGPGSMEKKGCGDWA